MYWGKTASRWDMELAAQSHFAYLLLLSPPLTPSFILLLTMLQSQEIARDVFPKLYYQ